MNNKQFIYCKRFKKIYNSILNFDFVPNLSTMKTLPIYLIVLNYQYFILFTIDPFILRLYHYSQYQKN
jgi:hypothetical protein